MSRIASDICLAVASAGVTALTFQMPAWTGVKSSIQWPIGAAVLMMVVWGVIQRREGFRIGLLLASIIGISLGLSGASAVHRAQLGRPPVPGLMILALITCTVMYIQAARAEQEDEKYRERLEQEFDAIKGMPPEEARRALEAHFAESRKLLDEFEERQPSERRRTTVLGCIGFVLTFVSLLFMIWPEPKPVFIILYALILVLEGYLLVRFARLPPV